MACAVLSYPTLKNQDYNLIQEFRKENDELYYSVAEPHISFVFPVFDIEIEQFMNEVHDKSKGMRKINFEMRCAVVNKDAVIDYFHLLLVPDKGHSDIVKLHDRLYSDLFFKDLRLDIDFIPHMGIANSRDRFKVKKWADLWNRKEFLIEGTIEKLTIIDYTSNILTDLNDVYLE